MRDMTWPRTMPNAVPPMARRLAFRHAKGLAMAKPNSSRAGKAQMFSARPASGSTGTPVFAVMPRNMPRLTGIETTIQTRSTVHSADRNPIQPLPRSVAKKPSLSGVWLETG